MGNDPSRWAPLVEALGSNETLRIVTFAYRSDNEDTHIVDTIAVFDYLRAERIDKIICIGAGFGATACTGLHKKPEIIGIVFFATNASAIDANFPKLFLTADADPFNLRAVLSGLTNNQPNRRVSNPMRLVAMARQWLQIQT